MVQTVDEYVLCVLEVFDLLTALGYDLLTVVGVWLIIMHELSGILNNEVAIITREVVEYNNGHEVSIIVSNITFITPGINEFISCVIMMSYLIHLTTIWSSCTKLFSTIFTLLSTIVSLPVFIG
jgi:hypothetical protein